MASDTADAALLSRLLSSPSSPLSGSGTVRPETHSSQSLVRAVVANQRPGELPRPITCTSAAEEPHYGSHQSPAGGAGAAGSSQANGSGNPQRPKYRGKGNRPRAVRSRNKSTSDSNKKKKKKKRGNAADGEGDRESDGDGEGDGARGDDSGPDRLGAHRRGGPLFACPWFKFDPDKYYSCCATHTLRDFKAVKEHCKRRHVLPEHSCERCGARFGKNPEEWSRHTKLGACEETPGPEELLPYEADLLDTDPDFGDEERWFELWDKVFRGHDRPDSPYLEPGPTEIEKLFLQRLQPRLRPMLSYLLDSFSIPAGSAVVQLVAARLYDDICRIPRQEARYRSRPHRSIGVVMTAQTYNPNGGITAHAQFHQDLLSAQASAPVNTIAGLVWPPGQLDYLHPGTGTSGSNALDPRSLFGIPELLGGLAPAFYPDMQPGPCNPTSGTEDVLLDLDSTLLTLEQTVSCFSTAFNPQGADCSLTAPANESFSQEYFDSSEPPEAPQGTPEVFHTFDGDFEFDDTQFRRPHAAQ